MYTLYGTPMNRSYRVLWLLEELGVPYENIPLKPHSPEMLAINPSGKCPALQDSDHPDEMIIDSTAIMVYLADKHGQFTFSAGSIERARQDSMMSMLLDEMEGALWQFNKHKFVLPKTLRSNDVFESARHEFEQAVKNLSNRFGDGPYIMGEKFTIADILLSHCIQWGKQLQFPWPDSGVLADFIAHVKARPAAAKAHSIRATYK